MPTTEDLLDLAMAEVRELRAERDRDTRVVAEVLAAFEGTSYAGALAAVGKLNALRACFAERIAGSDDPADPS